MRDNPNFKEDRDEKPEQTKSQDKPAREAATSHQSPEQVAEIRDAVRAGAGLAGEPITGSKAVPGSINSNPLGQTDRDRHHSDSGGNRDDSVTVARRGPQT